jgi:hypothetical protein
MSTKAFTSHEESFTGYKKLQQPREGDYSDSDDENYYDDYEPQSLFDEDAMFCDDDYEPFVAEEEHKSCVFLGRTVFKPIHWRKLSPSKNTETSPSKTSTWWDNTQLVDESKRLVNGVINYSAILPPPTKREVSKIKKKKKPGAVKTESKTRPVPSSGDPRTKLPYGPQQHFDEVQQPTRLCISVLKNKQCFHKERCRFAHNYADLKECNFGERCKKVIVVSRSETFIYHNKPEGTACTFKHANESKASYLHRVPHTTPPQSDVRPKTSNGGSNVVRGSTATPSHAGTSRPILHRSKPKK